MIAFISDVHANLPALEAVLADIDAVGCTRTWCLGDTVGYGPYASECVDLVRAHCELVLAGNHDLAVVGSPEVDEDSVPGMFQGGPGAGIHHARRVLSGEQLAWLSSLQPTFTADADVEACHGSRRDPVWEYVRTADSATLHLAVQERPLCAVGHTHMPLLWEQAEGGAEAIGGLMPGGTSHLLERGPRRVFNPGSVGQPRDRDPRAAWALLDRGTLSFHRVGYDVQRMRTAVTAAALPPETGERLELGW